jgi:hypothetical protein
MSCRISNRLTPQGLADQAIFVGACPNALPDRWRFVSRSYILQLFPTADIPEAGEDAGIVLGDADRAAMRALTQIAFPVFADTLDSQPGIAMYSLQSGSHIVVLIPQKLQSASNSVSFLVYYLIPRPNRPNEKRVQSTGSFAAAADGAAGCCESRAESLLPHRSSGPENRCGRRRRCSVRTVRRVCAGRHTDFRSLVPHPTAGSHRVAVRS